MAADSPAAQRRRLRRSLRRQRRALPGRTQIRAARAVARQVGSDPWLTSRRLWALYMASDGELDPTPLAQVLRRRGVQLALPIMARGRLRFAIAGRLRRGRFGILEPDLRHATLVPAWRLEVVVTPLVAFDQRGMRLGRGGGYYDRTFAPRPGTVRGRRPFLLGLAHNLQCVDHLPAERHDVPLDAVLTPTGLHRFAAPDRVR